MSVCIDNQPGNTGISKGNVHWDKKTALHKCSLMPLFTCQLHNPCKNERLLGLQITLDWICKSWSKVWPENHDVRSHYALGKSGWVRPRHWLMWCVCRVKEGRQVPGGGYVPGGRHRGSVRSAGSVLAWVSSLCCLNPSWSETAMEFPWATAGSKEGRDHVFYLLLSALEKLHVWSIGAC